jgi:5-methylcytosine-specific restriction endonuclease McrA
MPHDTTPTKTCTICGQEFPATSEFFYSRKNATDNLRADCKSCTNLRNKKWQDTNQEYLREYRREQMRKRRKANPGIDKPFNKKWRENNKEHTREYNKNYLAANRDVILEKMRKRKKENPERHRISERRRKARKRSLPDTFTVEQWFTCLEYFNHCCAVCGCQLRDLFGDVEPHADHWIPISYKGDDNPGTVAENMVCLCKECNKSKTNKPPEQWLIEKFGRAKAKQILSRINEYFNHVSKSTK